MYIMLNYILDNDVVSFLDDVISIPTLECRSSETGMTQLICNTRILIPPYTLDDGSW